MRTLTVQAKKYDGRVRKEWSGGLVSETDTLIVLVAKFKEKVKHNDLGKIKAGTVSFEHFWKDRNYNVFRFHKPKGKLLAFYVNICLPANIEGDTLSYIDLDIDVILWPDGRVEILDRDDFEVNRVKFSYPIEIIRKAEDALEEVLGLIKRKEFPFNYA